mgnify:FL=1
MHNPDDKPNNCFILLMFSNFSTFTQYMSMSDGHNTIGGIEGDCGEDKKKEIVSHQLGVSTGYGDAHQYINASE